MNSYYQQAIIPMYILSLSLSLSLSISFSVLLYVSCSVVSLLVEKNTVTHIT